MMKLLEGHSVISIIGMAKNVGKTTTLNFILKNLYHKKKIGLTSIGRDGEEEDVVTHTHKPRIYVECGTILATTTLCLKHSDITAKILDTTSIRTPLGEVVIIEALSDGYVDLAGPSSNHQMKVIIKKFKKYHVDMILIDGATSRKSLAHDDISDACILCTGAAYSSDMNKVVNDTSFLVQLFSLEKVNDDIKPLITQLMHENAVAFIHYDGKIQKLKVSTALHSTKEISQFISRDVKYLLIRGALTQEFLQQLIENRNRFTSLIVVVSHAVKCLFNEKIQQQLKMAHIKIQVLNHTRLLCVTVNPTSPYHYDFNQQRFKEQFKLDIPIYDVMRD